MSLSENVHVIKTGVIRNMFAKIPMHNARLWLRSFSTTSYVEKEDESEMMDWTTGWKICKHIHHEN